MMTRNEALERANRIWPNVTGVNHRLSLPPGSGRSAIVHEFAHHITHVLYDERGHGAAFRQSLVQVAAVAYGRADLYPLQTEYKSITSWAKRHGLVRP